MNLKCAPCTDQLIADGGAYPETELPDAVTMVTVIQQFGQIAAPSTVPICFACREKQLGKVSKQGLVTA